MIIINSINNEKLCFIFNEIDKNTSIKDARILSFSKVGGGN